MTDKQKKTLFWLIVAGIIYFCIFIIPNLTGSKDVNMLSVFEHDEFAQYPFVIHMLTKGATPYQTLRNFFVYLHYFYGYPFYFLSAISILPVKLILGKEWISNTRIIVVTLRQLINVLPMILAVLVLVWEQTRKEVLWKSISLFLFLLTIPAVVNNDLWWHPDSLLTLFSVMTIFFLILDDLRFGKFFFFSGVMCALAIGAKLMGVLFCLTYFSYLILGWMNHSVSRRKIFISALLVLVVIFISVIVTNPLLLLPIERGEIIAVFKENLSQSSQGFWISGGGELSKLKQIAGIITNAYGGLLILAASFVSVIAGLFKAEKRVKNLIILSWVVGYGGYFLVFASTIRAHYFIPVILPLYSTLFDLFPDNLLTFNKGISKKINWITVNSVLGMMLSVLLVFQLGKNLFYFPQKIIATMTREQTSPSIGLYSKFDQVYGTEIPQNRHIIVYRDWRAYVPEKKNWEIIYNWDLATYEYLAQFSPDFLFIEYENALYFSDTNKLAIALDKDSMEKMNSFYGDVLREKVNGYHLLIKDNFGYIFVSDELYLDYFK